MKKALKILGLLMLLLGMLSFVSCKEEEPTLSFTLSGDGTAYTVTGIGTVTDSALVVPSEYNGLPVVAVGDGAFRNLRNITSVVLPDSVLVIGKDAFFGCRGITSLTLGEDLVFLGDLAFSGCNAITDARLPVAALSEVYLGKVETLTVTGEGELPYRLLAPCSRLRDIRIGAGVSYIETNAFTSATKLASITVDEANAHYLSQDGHLYNKAKTVLHRYSPMAPATAFAVPAGVVKIDDQAFRASPNLTSVTLPGSVTEIGAAAFSSCKNLSSITLNEGILTIGASAFSECVALPVIEIPASCTAIGEYSFYGCRSLTYIYTPLENSSFVTDDGVLYTKDGKKLLFYPVGRTDTSFTVPGGVEEIGRASFYNCDNLTEVIFPESLKVIRESAFLDCSSITSIRIPAAVKSIGHSAFYLVPLQTATFDETRGWFITNDENAQGGTSMIVASETTNARNLRNDQRIYYWKRN